MWAETVCARVFGLISTSCPGQRTQRLRGKTIRDLSSVVKLRRSGCGVVCTPLFSVETVCDRPATAVYCRERNPVSSFITTPKARGDPRAAVASPGLRRTPLLAL